MGEEGVGGGEDGEEGVAVGFVFCGREVGGEDVTCAALYCVGNIS